MASPQADAGLIRVWIPAMKKWQISSKWVGGGVGGGNDRSAIVASNPLNAVGHMPNCYGSSVQSDLFPSNGILISAEKQLPPSSSSLTTI